MKPRRIALFVNTLVRAGTERNVATICKHMDRNRYVPEVWTLQPGGGHEAMVREAGVEIHCLGRRKSFSPRFAFSAARRIARCEADLFHAFLPAIMFYVGLAHSLFRAPQPIVYSEATSVPGPAWRRPLQAWMVRTQCAGYAANSPASRAYLAAQGVPDARIHTIPNGHDTRRFTAPLDREAMRASLGIRPGERLAVCVGRLIPTKRVCDLLEAVRLLGHSQRGLRLAIIGDGPLRGELQAQAQRTELNGIVEFMGARQDVVELLRCADLFVFPSEVEGLSNAVIEAALAGLPIVGCDVGGVNDVVANEREALLVPTRCPEAFAAAIQRYLTDADLAATHAARARDRAMQTYAIENTLERLYALYDQIPSIRG